MFTTFIDEKAHLEHLERVRALWLEREWKKLYQCKCPFKWPIERPREVGVTSAKVGGA